MARDARRKAGKKGKALSTPFLVDELKNAAVALNVSKKSNRFLIDRDGKIMLPDGAKLPVSSSISWKSPGKNIGAEAHVSDESILAKACSYREEICVAQIEPLPSLTTSKASSLAAALPVLERRISTLESESHEAVVAPVVDDSNAWLLLGSAWLLAALLFFFGLFYVRRQITAPLQDFSSRLESVAHGHPLEAPKSGPLEYSSVHQAIDQLANHIGSKTQLAAEHNAHNLRLHEVSDALRALIAGDTSLRFEMQGDVAETRLRTAFNALAEQVEARTHRLSSHLAQIQDSAGSTSSDAELLRKVTAIKPLAALLADISERLLHLADQPVQRQDLVRLSSAISQRGQAAEALVDSLEKSILRGASDGGPSLSFQVALEHLLQDLEELSTKKTLPVLLTALQGLTKEDLAERFSNPRALAPESS
ncbi:MAG: hypothetical protein GY822_18530 [Deltaproteobacteria bacterium]|nr:hypothetical protein [Deltaproteobacteria bacterium]